MTLEQWNAYLADVKSGFFIFLLVAIAFGIGDTFLGRISYTIGWFLGWTIFYFIRLAYKEFIQELKDGKV